MRGPYRLDRGGQIVRTKSLNFNFDGQELQGFEGDSLASALLASGVTVVGRGLKFHRPRGIFSAGIEEPNALLTLGIGARREPSVRATTQPLFEGLRAASQNCWPSRTFDLGRLNDLVYRLFPAGFYNKTFIWPSWHVFESAIRRVAGLGVAPDEPDPDRYEWRNAHCDVLVIGGGAAGMSSAHLAACSGARVMLLESEARLGGGLNWDRDSPSVLTSATRQLGETRGIRVLLSTRAIGCYDHGTVTAVEMASTGSSGVNSHWRQRWWRIRAKRLIVACGAFEQPLVFPFNDRPGVMLADAVRHYLNRYAVAPGRRVALATNNDTAYQVALDLRAAGVSPPCILDTRANPPADLAAAMSAAGITLFPAASILGTTGNPHLTSVEFVSASASGALASSRIQCDALGISGGWNPAAHLYCQARGRLRFNAHHGCLVPDGQLEDVRAVGAAAGNLDERESQEQTRLTTVRVLDSLGCTVCSGPPLWPELENRRLRSPTGALGYNRSERRDRAWLDLQHDVTVSDIDLAVRENLTSVEHVKRYTTLGMSIDQGKTSNINGLAVLAKNTDRSIAEVGTTTFRPMFTPVTLGAIAGGRNGPFYRPKRRLPAHALHARLGAHFEDYSGWQRPACYPRSGESQRAAIERESRAVRTSVGIYDASPLGKFLVRGPDAAEFLNRMFANTISTIAPGKVRYALVLNEQGTVIDDGVCARISPEEFWVNTTSAGAARTSAWFDEWLQCEWPQLQVVLTDVTGSWATLNLAGPRARDVLALLPHDLELGKEAFPHLHVQTGRLCGVPCRILRVSFSGELSYEISVPADFGASLWERFCTAGAPLGMTPFGVEALSLLRTEKGYLHIGADTDGTTIPDDVGFGPAVARKAGDFVGRRSLALPESMRVDRLQTVGLRCVRDAEAFVAGAHLLGQSDERLPYPTEGYLTSAVFSPTLGHHVGIGLLRSGRARIGQTVCVLDAGKESRAEVVHPSHYDAAGDRLNE